MCQEQSLTTGEETVKKMVTTSDDESLESKSRKKASNKEETFKGCKKHSVGTLDGAMSNKCNRITEGLAIQMGKLHGLAMKKSIDKGEETVCERPEHPKRKGEGAQEDFEEALADWKIDTDFCEEQVKQCADRKEKVFSHASQRCDETVLNRSNSDDDHVKAEGNGDVVTLMDVIKKLVTGSNDEVCPHVQTAKA